MSISVCMSISPFYITVVKYLRQASLAHVLRVPGLWPVTGDHTLVGRVLVENDLARTMEYTHASLLWFCPFVMLPEFTDWYFTLMAF